MERPLTSGQWMNCEKRVWDYLCHADPKEVEEGNGHYGQQHTACQGGITGNLTYRLHTTSHQGQEKKNASRTEEVLGEL